MSKDLPVLYGRGFAAGNQGASLQLFFCHNCIYTYRVEENVESLWRLRPWMAHPRTLSTEANYTYAELYNEWLPLWARMVNIIPLTFLCGWSLPWCNMYMMKTMSETHANNESDGDDAVALSKHSADDEDEEYEKEHVHAVYDSIAGHFSETRYKVLPLSFRCL